MRIKYKKNILCATKLSILIIILGIKLFKFVMLKNYIIFIIARLFDNKSHKVMTYKYISYAITYYYAQYCIVMH